MKGFQAVERVGGREWRHLCLGLGMRHSVM